MIIKSIGQLARTRFFLMMRFNQDNNKEQSRFKPGPYEIGEPVIGATYYCCTCGKSKKHPFCDHTHIGTKFEPIKFKCDEYKYSVLICGCQQTKTSPVCDTTCAKLWNDLKLSDNKPI